MIRSYFLLVIFLFNPLIGYKSLFTHLSQLQEYAKETEEFPKNDNLAWATPVYRTYWRKRVPSRWENFLYKIRVRSWPLWHAELFAQLLKKITKAHEELGYIDKFVVKMKPNAGSQFILWGDLQGAFHSLVRDLSYLKEKDYIDEELKIIKPNVYFVFNGNLVDRGPYSLEVLTVILRFIERNPGRIFYIRGSHEYVGHWKNFNLKDELILRAASVSKEEIPLAFEVDRFFNTLPLALYLVDKETEKGIDVLRISYFDRKFIDLNEENFSAFFFGSPSAAPTIYKLGGKSENHEKKVNVRVIIEGESRTAVYRPTPGLVQLEADKGATAWTLLSSPIESYRYLQDFYFDAFAILDIGKGLSDWTLTLYNQDVRELLGIQKYAIFNPLTGLREYQKERIEGVTDPLMLLKKQEHEIDNEIKKLKEDCSVAREYHPQDQSK